LLPFFFNKSSSKFIEYKLLKRLSIEGGINYLNIDRLKRKHTKEPIMDLPDEKYHLSPSVKMKIYGREVNEGFYWGLGWRWAKLNENNFHDGFFHFGFQLPVYRKFIGDITTGIGVKLYQEVVNPFFDPDYRVYGGKVYVPLSLKIGYLF